MRMRLRLELQDNSQVSLGTVTWFPSINPFATAQEIDKVFDELRDFVKGEQLRRRIHMLRAIADAEIATSAAPNITLTGS